MKKIRLLAPVLTVGALATAPLTMVSCNSQVTVTFKVDNKVTATQKVDKGSKVMEPKVPTKEGKVFTGWYYKNEKKKEKQFKFTETVDSDLTLEAKFSDATIVSIGITTLPNKISFNLNEDFSYEGIVITALLDDGSTYEVDPSYCEFTGYDKTTEGEKTITVTYQDYYETTYRVVVKPETVTTYTVTFKDGDTTLKTQTIKSGSQAVPYTPSSKTEYTFKWWYTTDSSTAFDFSTSITSNTTLNARYDARTISSISVKTQPNKVSYTKDDSFDGTGLVITVLYDNGETADVSYDASTFTTDFDSSTTGTKDLTITYSGETVTETKYIVSEAPVTYYAVTFNTMGGSVIDTQLVASGSTASKPSDPTKTGSTFNGWFNAASSGTAFDFNTKITSNTVIYAQWTVKTCSVVFFVGSESTTKTVNYGEKVSRPDDPTKTGYVFDGWYTQQATSPAFDFDTPITETSTNVYAHFHDASNVSIALTTLPTQIKFTKGDDFNYDGAVVTATRQDGSTLVVTDYCTFTGYNMSSTGTQTVTVSCYGITTSYKIVVEDAPTTYYTITFNVNDGSGNTFTETVKSGDKIVEPVAPTTEYAKTWKGWYTAASGGTAYDFTVAPTGNTVIYGQWTNGVGFNGVKWSTVVQYCSGFEVSDQSVSDAISVCKALGVTTPTEKSTAQETLQANLVGLTGIVKINDKLHTVRCIDCMHDTLADDTSSSATITLELADVLTNSDGTAMTSIWDATNNNDYYNSTLNKNLTENGSATATGAFATNSALALLKAGTTELSTGIKEVHKKTLTGAGSSKTLIEYNTTIFPLTYKELGENTFGECGGTAYQYYNETWSESKHIKRLAETESSASGQVYWSLVHGYGMNDAYVGAITATGGPTTVTQFSNTHSISFAFCL